MIKVLVTGGNGQLGQCLQDVAKHQKELEFDFQDLPSLDITDSSQVELYFSKNQFDYCINCAAYTAVDLAETQSELAYAVNAKGVKILAQLCHHHQVTLIHISTDFVFDGQKKMPYTEQDIANPLGVYGSSKLQGEQYLGELMTRFFIVRTSWLYSEYGNNFLKTMLKFSETMGEINVVSDQIGSPTYARDLAKALIKIILSSSTNYGVYHYSNSGAISWHDFAVEIFKQFGKKTCVKPIKTKDNPSAAKRPEYSVLDTKKIESEFQITTSFWKNRLKTIAP